MKYNLHIHVTQKHIDAGIRGSCSQCPIALAVTECLKPEYHGKGEKGCIEIYYSEREICLYALPMAIKASLFTSAFDFARPVKPFVFVLPEVDERFIANL